MKKLQKLLLGMFAVGALVFSSCGGDDEEATGPTLGFFNATSADATVEAGDTVTFTITASQGDADMDQITFREGGNALNTSRFLIEGEVQDASDIDLSGGDKNVFTKEISLIASSSSSVIAIAIVDKDGLTAGLEVSITVEEASTAPATSEATLKLLGAQLASAGSYYSTSEAKVYTSSETTADNSTVDFSFYQTGDADSPVATVGSLNARGDDDLSSNTSGNITYLAASSLTYASVTDDEIDAITASSTQKVEVALNGVYEFVTSGGKKGVFTVTAYTEGTNYDGDLTISVKVQD